MAEASPPRAAAERSVEVNGVPCRVWEKGVGEPVGYLAGLGGLPAWTPFLDRLAARRRVVAPSLPGFPGAGGLEKLDDLLDWVTATLDLLEGAGLAGADLIGASVGGMLAAEVAALSPATVKRLALVAPFGLFDAARPTADVFAITPDQLPALLCENPATFAARMAPPAGADAEEWMIVLARAAQAAARLLWPLGERGLAKRLHRISAPTLIVWGAADQVIPPAYAETLAAGIRGPTRTATIAGAGHLVDVDAPDELARTICDDWATRGS
jgi:pimeloyl-ACP methyl ester carboxylesterase